MPPVKFGSSERMAGLSGMGPSTGEIAPSASRVVETAPRRAVAV